MKPPFTEKTRLTSLAHDFLLPSLREGALTIDGTCGNGHDTIFLAKQVGASGKVWGFDIQKKALDKTQHRLASEQLSSRVKLLKESHCQILEKIPMSYHGQISAFTFNLGYLPGSDKSLITQPASSRKGIEAALCCLQDGGRGTVMLYRGHPGGEDETQTILSWCLNQQWLTGEQVGSFAHSSQGPLLLCFTRHAPFAKSHVEAIDSQSLLMAQGGKSALRPQGT